MKAMQKRITKLFNRHGKIFFALTFLTFATAAIAMAASIAASDSAEKEQILTSDRWKKVGQEFSQWLSMQVVYTPAQIEQIKAKLAAQVQNMPASELNGFLDQWDAKLKLLLGSDASEVREWLAQNLQVMADGYRKEFLKKLGVRDVTKMTAAEIEDVLDNIRAQRMYLDQQRAVFNTGRENKLQISQQLQTASSEVRQNAASGEAAQYGQFQSHYSPRQYNYSPLPPIMPFWW